MENVKELVQVFGRELSIVRGVKPSTILAYSKAIYGFSRWLGARSLLEAKRADFLAWREFEAPRRKPGGMQLQVSGVRSFYSWAFETQRIGGNPFPSMIVHRKPEDPKVPTTAQFLALRQHVYANVRKSALIELLAGSGLRIDAAISLRRDQLVLGGPNETANDWRARPNQPAPIDVQPMQVRDYIRIDPNHCKGYRASMVPMTPCAARAVKRYLETIPDMPDEPIFHWSYASAYRVVRDTSAAVGLRLSPHSFRHFFGCLMYWRSLDNTEHDTVWVRDAMGHSNIAVTDLYFRLARVIVHHDVDWHEVVWHGRPSVAPSAVRIAPAQSA